MWNLQARGRLAALVMIALAVQALAGCRGPAGSISGKVICKGQTLSGGTVTFIGADSKVATATIQPDGTYAVKGVAVGEAKIGVTPPASVSAIPKGMKMDPGKMGAPAGTAAPGAPASGKSVTIPEQYHDATKSGVTYTVKAGDQEHDIELK